jgi:hypothetical protein
MMRNWKWVAEDLERRNEGEGNLMGVVRITS